MKLFYKFCFIILLLSGNIYTSISEDFPNHNLVGNNNLGTEFMFSIPPAFLSEDLGGNMVYFYISSLYETEVEISVPSKGFITRNTVVPERVTELAIRADLAQIYLQYPLSPNDITDVASNGAIEIESKAPISVTAMIRYGSINEAFQLLPLSSLGRSYVVNSYPHGSSSQILMKNSTSLATIVSPYDNNNVEFIIEGNPYTSVSQNFKSGDTIRKYMNSGDVWVINTYAEGGDLSGCRVLSQKPVAVITGNQCAGIPVNSNECGYLAEMLNPISSWGKSFILPKLNERTHPPEFRIYYSNLNTKIQLNGIDITEELAEANSTNFNFSELLLSHFESGELALLESNYPIAVSMLNTSSEEDGVSLSETMTFMTSLHPIEQYHNEVFFHVPALKYGKKFNDNFLIVSLIKDKEDPFIFNLGEQKENILEWTEFPKNRIISHDSIAIGENKFAHKLAIRIHNNGVFRLKSNHHLSAIIYGYSDEESFCYPAFTKTNTLTNIDNQVPYVNYEMSCGGDVRGIVEDAPFDESRSNLSAPFIQSHDDNYWYNYSWQFDRITPGMTSKANWSLKTIDKNKDAKATILFKDMAGNDTTLTIFYYAPDYSTDKDYISFGSVKIGVLSENSIIVTNNSDSLIRITNIIFSNGDKGFTTDLELIPILIQPKEAISIPIYFETQEEGNFVDSIGIELDCSYSYLAKLEAWSGVADIEVDDINFGDIEIGKEVHSELKVKNNGTADLLISKVIIPEINGFEIDLNAVISDEFPLSISPNQWHTFIVKLSPTIKFAYDFEIIFSSNASKSDSICKIRANSIANGLISSSHDWGNLIINREEFPVTPKAGNISIKNNSSTDLKIENVEVFGDQSAFQFNKFEILNRTIQKNDSLRFEVLFSPKEIGNYEMNLIFTDNLGNETTSYLFGIGTLPKSHVSISDFDTILVYDNNLPLIRDLVINNSDLSSWQFGEELTIYSIEPEMVGEVGFNNYGSKGFMIVEAGNELPKRISPGESFKLRVQFKPQEAGLMESKLIIRDNSDIPLKTILLRGFGASKNITAYGGTAETCIFNTTIIESVIKNNGSIPFEVGKVTFSDFGNDFTFEDNNLHNGFFVEPNSEKRIKIKFHPTKFEDQSTEILVYGADKESIEAEARINGSTSSYSLDAITNPLSANINPGDKISVSSILQTEPTISDARIDKLMVSVVFDSRILRYIKNTLNMGSSLKGEFKIGNLAIDNAKGNINFEISSLNGNIINSSGVLFNLEFDSFLPNENVSSSTVSINLTTPGNTCPKLSLTNSVINLNSVCGDDIRKITGGIHNFDLEVPNLISNDNLQINYSTGITSRTLIRIYDANGNLIDTVEDSVLPNGIRSESVNISGLSSGLYFVQMDCGHFRKVQKFMVIN